MIASLLLVAALASPVSAATPPKSVTLRIEQVTRDVLLRAAMQRMSARTRRSQWLQTLQRSRKTIVNPVTQRPTPVVQPAQTPDMQSIKRDTMPDTSVRSNFLPLGKVTSVVAGAKVFSNSEPIDATAIVIRFTAVPESVTALLVYNEDSVQLGTAVATGLDGSEFTLSLPTGRFSIPYREEVSLYVRARMKPHDAGGSGGEEIRVSSVSVRGYGAWSNQEYTKSSTDTFPAFMSSRATITVIQNGGPTSGVLVAGSEQLLGTFRFTGTTSDNAATLRLSALEMQLEKTSGVGVSNAFVRRDAGESDVTCTVSSSTISCPNIPAASGTFDHAPLVLRVYGDVTVSGIGNETLRLTINDPGSISSGGAITWTDGSATYDWVPFDQPVVRGTQFSR